MREAYPSGYATKRVGKLRLSESQGIQKFVAGIVSRILSSSGSNV